MAKECINCGAEIKFYQDYFCLMNQGVYFCGTCAQKAKPLLQDIKIALSDASYQSAKKKFDEELPQSGLSDRAQKYLQCDLSGRQNDHRVRTGRADAVHQAADPRWRVSCCDGSL